MVKQVDATAKALRKVLRLQLQLWDAELLLETEVGMEIDNLNEAARLVCAGLDQVVTPEAVEDLRSMLGLPG